MKRLLLVNPFLLCVAMLNAQVISITTRLDRDKKIDSLQKLISIQSNDTVKANALFALGILYDKKENYEEVLRLGNQLMSLSKQLNYKKGTGLAYILICKQYQKTLNVDKASKNIFIALDLLKQTGYSEGLAICYKTIHLLNMYLGKSDLAIRYLDSAMLVWQQLGNNKELADSYILKGTILTDLEEHGAALESQYMALHLYEKLNEQTGLAYALGSIGYAYLYSNNDSLALVYITKALDISRKNKEIFFYADDIMTLGDLKLKQGKHAEAIKCYNEGFELFHLPGAKKAGLAWSHDCFGKAYTSIGDSAMNAGDIVAANKNYEKAFQNFTLTLADYLTFNSTWGIADVKISLGLVSYKLGKYELAKKNLNEGLYGFRNISSNTPVASAYLYLSKIDSLEGNLTEAYKKFKLYNYYREKSLISETDKKIEIYRTSEKLEQKENEIKQLETENLLKTTLAQKQNQKKIFAYGIMATVVLLGGYGFYRYRRFSKIKSEKKSLRDRLLISQDLHDNVGSTLSSISVFSKVAQLHGEQNNKEEMQSVLSRISETSGEMVSEMNDIVWAINPKNDNMEKIIQRMESFAKPMLASRNIGLCLDYEPSVAAASLDMEIRKNLYLIFKEAINNAFKYSGCSAIHAVISKTDHQLNLTIKDNGVGFDVNREMKGDSLSLSGNGLRNMRSRVEEMKGKFWIESIPGDGTEIKVRIPIT